MKSRHGFMISILFLIVLVCINFKAGPHADATELYLTKNVLIINSYHQDFKWTKDETEGITQNLTESGSNINISIEYMDWKNYPSDDNLSYLYEYYKYKYKNKELDLIITTDDAALKFALSHREELFMDAPVVFCGVNQEGSNSITKDFDRVTGVIEAIDPTETIELSLQINPSINNLYLIHDNTESGKTTGNMVKEKIKQSFPEINIVSCNDMVFKDLIDTIRKVNQDSIILVTTYYSDADNNILEMDYVNRTISANSPVPVYQLYDFGLNNGAIGGIMLSGKKQGENAANLALRILYGENPEVIPIITPNSTFAALDHEQMDRFGIPTDSIPEYITIINEPFSFYETYKSLVLGVIAIITVLVLFINILLFYIRRIRRMKKHLADNNEELTQLYEELTASDEEMKQQYDEILEINDRIRLGEEKLVYLAYHDVLTGLPNKLSLFEESKNIFNPKNGKTALLFIDIDNFKNVNDTMGHAFGDELIKSVSERLTSILEEKHSIYRLSGDEFIVVLKEIKKLDDVQRIAIDMLSRFTLEFEIEGSFLNISLSIGIAMYPEHGNSLEELLKYADIAMYKVKESGKKNYLLFNELMNELLVERVNMEKYLPKALKNEELELYYQPQYDLKSKQITGFEALLRWHSPELGKVSPVKFIKVAEDNRLIIPIGTWVLESACTFLKKLDQMGYQDYFISVNISIIQLLQTDFCELVYEILKKSEIAPRCLELEITESVLMESIESIGSELKRLHDWGIKIALDDFGKGYSSLNYLNQLPISTLKIDKSFIDIILDEEENALPGQIVALGKCMGMSVVAEGVEKQEQLEYLEQYDCDKIQGYLFSRPIPEAEIIRLLERINKARKDVIDI